MTHLHWLVFYDIREERRLVRVAKAAARYGVRVQNSVFEMAMSEYTVDKMKKQMESIVEEGDFVAIIPLCESDFQKTERYGSRFVSDAVSGKLEIL